MIVTFTIKRVFFENDELKIKSNIIDKQDYNYYKQKISEVVGVDKSKIKDDIDPVDYIDLFGVTLFSDR